MSIVDIVINHRKFAVSCDSGQELRLRELGEHVARRLKELVDRGATGSDSHLLVLTCLTLADENFDRGEEVERLRARLNKAHSNEAAVSALDNAARRIEALAARLERP